MDIKMFNIPGLIISHVFGIVGLILVTIGISDANTTLHIVGMWLLGIGICSGMTAQLIHLHAKIKEKNAAPPSQ